MIESYKQMSLRKFREVSEFFDNNREQDDYYFVTNLIAILNDCDLDTILELPIEEFEDLSKKLAFLHTEPKVNKHIPDKYIINGTKYILQKNVNTINTGQFIDLQEYLENNMGYEYFLSVILLPEGKTYSETNIEQSIKDIGDLDIETCLSIVRGISEGIAEIIKAFPTLFGHNDKDGDDEGSEGGEEEIEGPTQTGNGFTQKFKWTIMIHRVSEITRFDWHKVYSLNIIEFLNIFAYYVSLKDYEKAEQDKILKKHKK